MSTLRFPLPAFLLMVPLLMGAEDCLGNKCPPNPPECRGDSTCPPGYHPICTYDEFCHPEYATCVMDVQVPPIPEGPRP